MVSAINWETNPSLTAYLGAELNGLANDAQVIGAAIDNSAGLDMYMDLELLVAEQGSARSAGAHVDVYLISSLDGGTNYGYGAADVDPPAHALVWVFALDAATNARYVTSKPFLVGPGHHKLLIENKTGQAFAASGSTLKHRLFSEEAQ
jgi:hypothetical protein